MTIASMTGFARVSGQLDNGAASWIIELKSVNARALDVKLRLPPTLEHLEPVLRAGIGKALVRGSCQLLIQLSRPQPESALRLNVVALGALYRAVNAAANELGAGPVDLCSLLALKGIFETDARPEADGDAKVLDAAILGGFENALDALIAARHEEGRALSAILGAKVDEMARLVASADALPSRQPDAVRKRLEEAIRLLVENGPSFDPQRLHQEAILMATKADIREELDRLHAHIGAARVLLTDGGSVGRRLDFLAQEFTRESNTLCAKSSDIALTAIGLDLKTLVEQFREQIQNVE